MRAPALLVVLLAAFPAMADAPLTVLPGAMPSLSQGRGTAQRFAPAPVPNPNLVAPRSARDPNAMEVSPGLTRTNTGRALAGDGFAPGSAYTGELERRGRSAGLGSTLAPSLNLRMPVQVDVGSSRP
jgi:hypothetical protein